MSINKKRIAERQRAAEAAARKEKNAHTAALVGAVTAIVAAIAVFAVAIVLIVSGSKVYYADITIENYGTVTVKLDADAAPITCENFMDLAESGFYDGLTFHRIIEGFMMQGGDPDGNGTGGSNKEIRGEFSANGWDNPISHVRGTISMARSDPYDSASSQFFIVHEDSTFLDGKYAAFGQVVEGMEVVDAICAAAEPTDDNGTIPAAKQPVITSVTIRS